MDRSRFGVGGGRNVEFWKTPLDLGACFRIWMVVIVEWEVNWFETDKMSTKMANNDPHRSDMANGIWEPRTGNGCSSSYRRECRLYLYKLLLKPSRNLHK